MRSATAELQLPDEKAGHDRLLGAGIIGGEEKTDSSYLQKVVVDCLELVGQRVDARDREPEVRIELVGHAEGVSLHPAAEELPSPS